MSSSIGRSRKTFRISLLLVAHEGSKYGIKGHMLAYIIHYLKDRTDSVKYQGPKYQIRDFV